MITNTKCTHLVSIVVFQSSLLMLIVSFGDETCPTELRKQEENLLFSLRTPDGGLSFAFFSLFSCSAPQHRGVQKRVQKNCALITGQIAYTLNSEATLMKNTFSCCFRSSRPQRPLTI